MHSAVSCTLSKWDLLGRHSRLGHITVGTLLGEPCNLRISSQKLYLV